VVQQQFVDAIIRKIRKELTGSQFFKAGLAMSGQDIIFRHNRSLNTPVMRKILDNF